MNDVTFLFDHHEHTEYIIFKEDLWRFIKYHLICGLHITNRNGTETERKNSYLLTYENYDDHHTKTNTLIVEKTRVIVF